MSEPQDHDVDPFAGVDDSHDVDPGPVDPGPLTPPSPAVPAPAADPSPDTTATPEPAFPNKVAVRYHVPDGAADGELVSLPGYLNPLPGQVSDGVVFCVDGAAIYDADGEQVELAGDRFEILGAYDPAVHSPLAQLSEDELVDKLQAITEVDPKAAEVIESSESREQALARLGDYEKANPQPPEQPGDVVGQSTPSEEQ